MAEFDEQYIITAQNNGLDSEDSDFDKIEFKTGNYQFSKTTAYDKRYDSSVDLGLYVVAGLGNRVWIDKNYDGIQDEGEEGKEGVYIELIHKNNVIASTTTTTNGYYFFEDIEPGLYTIQMTMPSDFYLTHEAVGSDDELDSNGQLKTNDDNKVVISDYQLNMNESITSLDIGIYQLGSIGDYVWFDSNKDGIQDIGESPFANNIEVEISGEGITRTTETDDEGKYLFEDLVPGEYVIRFYKPGSYRFSADVTGDDNELDSNPNSGGIVEGIILASGEKITSIDAGLYKSAVVIIPILTPTPTPEAIATPEATIEPTPNPEATATPQATLAPNPTPGPGQPPVIKELKPETPTIDLPEEDKPKERIFIVDEEVDEVTVVKEPDHGSVIVDDGNNIIYTPDETFEGSDTIVVLIEDGDDDFLMEIDIFEEDIAEAQLAELPATSGVPTTMYYLLGSILAMAGLLFKKKN